MAKNKTKVVQESGMMGYVLFMSWVGALVYFVQQSEGFSGFVVAFLKSLVWPAYVLHSVLQLLNL